MDFIWKVGKLTIPSFDGSSKCIAKAWVQKLDTYYKLNQMTETKAISFATLHLEGEAHEWSSWTGDTGSQSHHFVQGVHKEDNEPV